MLPCDFFWHKMFTKGIREMSYMDNLTFRKSECEGKIAPGRNIPICTAFKQSLDQLEAAIRMSESN
jgi:hypothetical protein